MTRPQGRYHRPAPADVRRDPIRVGLADLHVIIGGIASGKSAVAEALATRLADGGSVTYLATSMPSRADGEMATRIDAHRSRRPPAWVTVEAARDLGAAMVDQRAPVVLLEDVGVLAATLLPWITADPTGREIVPSDARPDTVALVLREIASLRLVLGATKAVVAVCQDPGGGVVPTSAVARLWLDVVGQVNQALVRDATSACVVIAGIAIDLR